MPTVIKKGKTLEAQLQIVDRSYEVMHCNENITSQKLAQMGTTSIF